jgi:hypothetical protein
MVREKPPSNRGNRSMPYSRTYELLAAWRAAERELGRVSDPADVARLERRVDGLRTAYREAAREVTEGLDVGAHKADRTPDPEP